MTIDRVHIQSESTSWVVLEIHKGCIVVLPREQFVAGLKKGKAFRRAAAMRAREADAERSAALRRSVKGS